MHRRAFIKTTLASGALALSGLDAKLAAASRIFSPAAGSLTKPSADQQALADTLIAYAKTQGATYCDVRISRYAVQSVGVRNHIVTGISDSDSFGMGIRVIKSGTWGFQAIQMVAEDSGKSAVDRAIQMAEANSKLQSIPLDLAPVTAVVAEWKTPIVKNPFEVSFADRASFLLSMHSLAESVNISGKKLHIRSQLTSVREEKYFASSDGSKIWQEITRIDPSTNITVSDSATGEFASRALFVMPQGRGYEYVESYPYKDEITQAAQEAAEKLTAKSVDPGKYDLVLHPTHLWLTLHESIGHPTELDRIMGYEANFAGTSFVAKDDIRSLNYASDFITVVADRTQEGGLATVGFDDDGVPSQSYELIHEGRLVGLQTTREQAKMIGETASRGQSYAQGWWNVPFQRMPNVSIQPNPTKRSLDDMIADTDSGILIKGNSSYSIDQQRYNFQFTGQVAYQINRGKLGPMLRDVAYQSKTTEFWKRCDSVCDKSEYMLGGAMNDGKGEPMQSNPLSHGCPAARFSRINVINTKSQSAGMRSGMIEYDE